MKSGILSYHLKAYWKELFFPEEHCMICGQIVDSSREKRINSICCRCDEQLETIEASFCKRCHKPLYKMNQVMTEHQLLCEDCLSLDTPHLTKNRSAVIYNDFMKEVLALYKYRGKETLAEVFSYLLKLTYDAYFEKIDILTYIPLHPSRLVERGFNQAEQLAIQLHVLIGVPVFPIMNRVKDTTKQSKTTSKSERKKQLDKAFVVDEEYSQLIKDKDILIVDDIYTTGSTLEEAAKILREEGAHQVYSLTLARAIFSRSFTNTLRS